METNEAVFRCCGRSKIPENTSYRTAQGKRYAYCRACRNTRERRYRKANRARVNAWKVRQGLRKQGVTVPQETPIPRVDWLVLAGLQADILADIGHAVQLATGCLEYLASAYKLGAARGRLGEEEKIS